MTTENNISWIFLIQLLFAGIAITFLKLKKIEAGEIFFTIFVIATVILALIFILIEIIASPKYKSVIYDLIKIPFNVHPVIDSLLYLSGWALIMIPFLFSSGSLNFSVYQIPLAADNIVSGVRTSLSAAQLEGAPFWSLFTVVKGASAIEEYMFAIVMFLVGAVVVLLLDKALDNKLDYTSTTKWVIFSVGMALSVLTFALAHLLNGSYVVIGASAFIGAMLFRFFMNSIMYIGRVAGSFLMGLHGAFNFTWFVGQYGWKTTLTAFSSELGIIWLAFEALPIVVLVANYDKIGKYAKEFYTQLKVNINKTLN